MAEPLTGPRQYRGIARVGDVVLRPLHRNSTFVHALLRHFEAVDFGGTPRLLGIDDAGREILTHIDGDVFVPGNLGVLVHTFSAESW